MIRVLPVICCDACLLALALQTDGLILQPLPQLSFLSMARRGWIDLTCRCGATTAWRIRTTPEAALGEVRNTGT